MKFLQKIRSLSKRSKLIVAVLGVGLIVAVPVVRAEFYPDRRPFDYNKTTGLDCNDPNNPARDYGRCGSMNGPVFNSFINTPKYGDERMFFDGRRTDEPTTGAYKNVVPNVTEGSKKVVLRTFVHNNANQSTNGTVGVATGTNVRIALPTATEQVMRARSYISATNAALVEDTVDLTANEKFTVTYDAGSATIYSNGPVNGQKLSDSIVTTGAPIGYDALNGNLPGCFEYAAFVEITVTITPKPTPNIQLSKEVRKAGETQWHKEVAAKPGEEVQWKLATKNVSNADLTNVTLRDVLPPHVQLVSGSVRIIDASQDTVQQDGPLFTNNGMITAANQQPGGIRYVSFKTKTLGNFDGCEIRVRNVALVRTDQTPEQRDDADVIITKENCQPTNPAYKCDMLTATPGANRKVKFDTTASATGGAQIVLYEYDFGDNTEKLVTDKASVEHTYANDGRYVARVRVQVRVNGEIKYAESDKCAAAVTFTTPGQPGVPVTPAGSVTTLPNTGIGSVLGIFAAVSAVVAIAYHRFLSRQLNS